MNNFHFHGLHVSPERPQDDGLTMISVRFFQAAEIEVVMT
jgi:hypothetical protein